MALLLRRAFSSRSRSLQLAGSSVLHTTSSPVALPQPDDRRADLQSLLDDMTAVLEESDGMGLSAPQLGVPLRLFMIARGTGARRRSRRLARDEHGSMPDGHRRPPRIMVNPRIVKASRAWSVGWETCLSVPDYGALVVRPSRLEVEYERVDGTRVARVLAGDRARVFHHELDHLDGILFTARMFAPSFAHVSQLQSAHAKAALEELFVQDLQRQHEEVEGSLNSS